jgi:hypothetical protein
MAARDYFSIGREISPQREAVTTPHSSVTPTEDEVTAPRRIYLRTSTLHAENSPSHRAITSSHWTRYTTSPIPTPSCGQLKASVLCKASGTSASYDPPANEWTFLGVGQPVNMTGKPEVREKWCEWRRRRSPGGPSRSASPTENAQEGIKFSRQPIKRVSMESELTRSIMTGSEMEKTMTTAEKYGPEGMTCDDLPSAFDSDSEDDFID